MPTSPVAYPMIFWFKELVSGKGFLTAVTGCGRALMVQEDDGAWWMYGVEPGGLAEAGDTPPEAHLKFVEAFRGVLSDLAAEAGAFSQFEARAKELFHQVSKPDQDLWSEKAEAVRSGALTPGPPFSALPKQPFDTPRYISVQALEPAMALPAAVSTFQQSLPSANTSLPAAA